MPDISALHVEAENQLRSPGDNLKAAVDAATKLLQDGNHTSPASDWNKVVPKPFAHPQENPTIAAKAQSKGDSVSETGKSDTELTRADLFSYGAKVLATSSVMAPYFARLPQVNISANIAQQVEGAAASMSPIWHAELNKAVEHMKTLAQTLPGFPERAVGDWRFIDGGRGASYAMYRHTTPEQYTQFSNWRTLSGNDKSILFQTTANGEYIKASLSTSGVGKHALKPIEIEARLPAEFKAEAKNWNTAVAAHNQELNNLRQPIYKERAGQALKEGSAFILAQVANHAADKCLFTDLKSSTRTDVLDLAAAGLMFLPRTNVLARAGGVTLAHIGARLLDKYDQTEASRDQSKSPHIAYDALPLPTGKR